MGKRSLVDRSGEVRELTGEDFASAVRFDQMPAEHQAAVRAAIRYRGPQKAPTKTTTTIRLEQTVLDYFKGGGPGWQTRINETLAAHVAAVTESQRAPKKAATKR